MDTRDSPTVIDAHVDLLYDLLRHHPETRLADLPADAWVSLPKLSDGGVRVIVSAFYCEDAHNGPVKAADNLRFLLEYAEKYLSDLITIRTGEDLESCYHGTGSPGALLLLENADALLEFPPEILERKGFRIVGLTHVGKNRIGDGNAVQDPGGLSPEGRNLVKELDRMGFAIDTAHLSEPCFREVTDIFSGPLLSSHTGLRAFCDTPRNLSEEQIRIILSRGGVIGLAAYPGMLSSTGKSDISDVFRQIDWLTQKYGPGGVAIGSDFGGYNSVCEGFDDHSRIPKLAEMLSVAGYPDTIVEGILGGNWFRFFSEVLAG
jgi:membrane dipeptidase